MTTSTIRFPGDYRFASAALTSYNGAVVDITELIHEVRIYEDIFSPFLTMEILIEDQVGLYHKLPIMGEELISISLESVDGEHGFKDFVFSVYKSKDFLEKGQRGFLYTLCCISVEAIKDMNLKISKAYKGTASSIVKSLLKKEALETDKQLYLEETNGNLSYISNYWPPIKNIKYLTQRAISQATNSPSYLFFENKFGFWFTSMATLKGQEPASSFYYSANVKDDVESSLQRVEKLHIDRSIDYIERIQSGAMGSNCVYVDPTRKDYIYRYYDFLAAFEKQPRLNELPFSSNDATRRINGSFHLNTTPTMVLPGMNNEYSERWYQERMAELGAMRSFDIQIDVPGSMHVSIGQTSDFYMYSGDVPTSTNTDEVMDRMFSGRYLITSVCHVFNQTRHSMSLTLSKDSLIKST